MPAKNAKIMLSVSDRERPNATRRSAKTTWSFSASLPLRAEWLAAATRIAPETEPSPYTVMRVL
ncbi:MAG TPA: hypothetical protein VNA04_02200 [Thermoanaerobaculia bacterium]|nr:hypothetical protein [Thermoanaerobaculia bacterium]